jgi:thiol-disulfide isomerase/thioredoxin
VRRAGALAAVLLAFAADAGAADLRPWTGDATPPGLVLKDLEGREHRLADYRGKVVLLNFWATWCEPCREEMPAMQRLQRRLAGKPFVVLAVDFGEGEPRVRTFLRDLPLKFTFLLDRDGSAARAWRVRVLPVSFLIDGDQKIRYSAVGDAAWDSPAVERTVLGLLPREPLHRAGHNTGIAPSGAPPVSEAEGAHSWIDVRF